MDASQKVSLLLRSALKLLFGYSSLVSLQLEIELKKKMDDVEGTKATSSFLFWSSHGTSHRGFSPHGRRTFKSSSVPVTLSSSTRGDPGLPGRDRRRAGEQPAQTQRRLRRLQQTEYAAAEVCILLFNEHCSHLKRRV